MAKTIAVSIRKGGSAKTTTATNLASALHLKGKRVLLVDTDPQANATLAVGIDPTILKLNLADLFTSKGLPAQDAIVKASFGLDLIPAHPELSKVEQGLGALDFDLLGGILEPLAGLYDYVLVDTPPAESKLTLNALACADEVLIPLQAHFLALQGLQQALAEIAQIQRKVNKRLKILGVLPTQVQSQTNIGKQVLEQLTTEYADLLLPYQVEYSVRIAEAQVAGVPLVILDPSHKASEAYAKLAERIIKNG